MKLNLQSVCDTFFIGNGIIYIFKNPCEIFILLTKTTLTFYKINKLIFKMIKTLDFKAEFIVARKRIDVFTKRHKRNENIFYNEIVSRLFEKNLHHKNNTISNKKS